MFFNCVDLLYSGINGTHNSIISFAENAWIMCTNCVYISPRNYFKTKMKCLLILYTAGTTVYYFYYYYYHYIQDVYHPSLPRLPNAKKFLNTELLNELLP